MHNRNARYFSGLAALLILPMGASANAGPRPHGDGATIGEPSGLKDVAITKETLTIDLRPLANAQSAQVEAIYHLANTGDERTIELLFAAGSEVADFQVGLDGRPVASQTTEAKLPESWQPPTRTPGIQGSLAHPYRGDRNVKPVAFTITLRPGSQVLKVSYQAKVAFSLQHEPTFIWQFAYVLAPAKEWASFGSLDVTVHLPEGWHASPLPALTRDGDVLRGRFAELPADAIALTLQAPPGVAYELLSYGSKGLLFLVGVVGFFLCGGAGALRERNGTRSLGVGLVWGLALLCAGALAIHVPNVALPDHQHKSYGYGPVLAMIGVFIVSLLAVLAGFIISMVASGLRKIRAAPPIDVS
jgi:hypothetical protein